MRIVPFRILLFFIVLFPLVQYLGTFQVDPHLPWWQESVYTNSLLAFITFDGIVTLWAEYEKWKAEMVKAYIRSWGLGL